jgi:hypothetical protein
MRVVVTLTTVPGREDVITPACNSIINQTVKPDAIYITLPRVSRRMGQPYGKLPDELEEHCTVVNSEEDYGPITKIYGGIFMEPDPETIIISCDDDIIYPSTMIEELLDKSRQYPDACICPSGMLVSRGMIQSSTYTNMGSPNGILGFIPPKTGRKVDLIFGCSGVLYKRKFFPSNEETLRDLFLVALTDNSILCNDDVLISAFLEKRGIVRMTFPNMSKIQLTSGNNPQTALSYNYMQSFFRMNESINKLKQMGYFTAFEQLGFEESCFFNILLIIISVLLVIGLIIIMWQTIYNPIASDRFNNIIYI